MSDPFTTRNAKTDAIKAVKLSETNIKAVAAHVARQELDVAWAVDSAGLLVGPRLPGRRGKGKQEAEARLTFRVGDWVLEDYDYGSNLVFFRLATLDEREKYDLR